MEFSGRCIHTTNTRTCVKTELYCFILCNFLILRAMSLILAIFPLSMSSLSLPFHASAIIVDTSNPPWNRTMFFWWPPVSGLHVSGAEYFLMYYFHCDALESKDDDILFNQEQPLVCLGCSYTPSANSDCEIFQKNSKVGPSTTKIFENKTKTISLCSKYHKGSSQSTFT